ncbi:hypothetical protein DCE93_01450 [Agromyces badenianii]|uniref:Uncharacterized protein n=1 Tax=Agromyces badenianii TaxID=2080742 RepID=A0A2S0WT80_9MICO|nr:hypothetical protein [Agromyces badenianii]AWB94501.1 hypothetical protein DCE93_01450 [Agromyces badenianii]
MRIGAEASVRVLHRRCSELLPARRARGRGICESGVFVLDVVYLLGIIAVFVLVGLIARGVEKL